MISANSPVQTHPPLPNQFQNNKSALAPNSGKRSTTAYQQSGVDLYRALNIYIYKNGDPYFQGRKIVVSPKKFKNFEQLLSMLTAEIRLYSGAVRRVYDLKGHRIQAISDFVNFSHYVAAGNVPFKSVSYPLVQRELEKPKASHIRLRTSMDRGNLLSSSSLCEEDSPFHDNNKAIRIAIFINGDTKTPPHKMVLCHRTCKNFEQFITDATACVRLKEGRIRRLYDGRTGKVIRSLMDLKDGQNLLASGTNAPMIKLMYPFYDFTTSTDVRRLSWLSRETNTLINVYPNGDVLHTGIKVTVNPYRFRDLKGLLTFLNHEIPLYTGQAAQLFTLTGTKITDLSMLENNGRYVVAAAMDSFIKAQYNSDRYHKSMILLAPPPPPPPSKMAEDLQSPKHMISQTHQIDLSLKRKQSPSTSPSPADFHSPMAQGKHHSRPPSQLKEKFQT